MTSADPNRQKLTQLRKLLIKHFSLDELRVLCFDLGLEYEELPGDTRTTKMHGLIEYLQRRGELARLLNEVIDYRPKVTWPSFEEENLVTEEHEPAKSKPQSFIHEKSGLEMLLIPAGEFLYGEEKELKFLPDFWMAKTPVTNAHYAKFVQDAGYKPPPHWWENGEYPEELANHPVVWVSWHDAAAYSQWAGLRLPTTQQWEKAARGQDGREFPWGNEWKPYCNTAEAGIGGTSPVGYYSPFGDSPYGCVDMCGNVREWVDSWFLAFESKENEVDSWSGDKENELVQLCGGSWGANLASARIVARIKSNPVNSRNVIGFRVASLVVSGV